MKDINYKNIEENFNFLVDNAPVLANIENYYYLSRTTQGFKIFLDPRAFDITVLEDHKFEDTLTFTYWDNIFPIYFDETKSKHKKCLHSNENYNEEVYTYIQKLINKYRESIDEYTLSHINEHYISRSRFNNKTTYLNKLYNIMCSTIEHYEKIPNFDKNETNIEKQFSAMKKVDYIIISKKLFYKNFEIRQLLGLIDTYYKKYDSYNNFLFKVDPTREEGLLIAEEYSRLNKDLLEEKTLTLKKKINN